MSDTNRRDGFTLIEVLVALVVMAVGLLALSSTIPLFKRDVTRSAQRTRAVLLAEETAEWLHGLAYDDSLLIAGTHEEQDFEPSYSRSWTVVTGVPIAQVKRVSVTVTRDDQPDESATMFFLHAAAGR